MTVKGILIKPEQTVVTIQQVSNEELPLEKMYELLDCSTVDVVSIDNEIDIWVDDEGLFKQGNMVMEYRFGNDAKIRLTGNVLFLSSNDKGETIGLNGKQLDWLQQNLAYRPIGFIK